MLRQLPVLIAIFLLSCGSPQSDPMRASPDDIKLAREFIESMQKNQGYFLGLDGAVQNGVDSKALLRGAIQLLKEGKEEEREKAAAFLGRLGDKEAVGSLVDVLADPNVSLAPLPASLFSSWFATFSSHPGWERTLLLSLASPAPSVAP